jgi:hypothetical protein
MKKFEELTEAEKYKLQKVGLLWELYPEQFDNAFSNKKPVSQYEFYPAAEIPYESPFERPRFFLEMHTWDGKNWNYKICQRVFLLTEEEYQVQVEAGQWLIGIEGHPYTLHEGKLTKIRGWSIDSKEFLIYLVDALNEKVQNDNVKKITETWERNKNESKIKK